MSRKWVPDIWGEDLKVINGSRLAHLQVDDPDCIFTGGYYRDMTAFFRYPEMMMDAGRLLAEDGQPKRVLSLPASVGCEAYTLAAVFAKHSRLGVEGITVDMADISARKLEAATTGVYPKIVERLIPENYREHLNLRDDFLVVSEAMKKQVRALPAFDVMDAPEMAVSYDMVVCLNMLCYLPDLEAKIATVKYLASLSQGFVFLSHGSAPAHKEHGKAVDDAMREAGFIEQKVYGTDLTHAYLGQRFIREP